MTKSRGIRGPRQSGENDGDRSGNVAEMRDRAEDDPSREIEAIQTQPAERRCLCGCGQRFLSVWRGDRFIKGHRSLTRDVPHHWDGAPLNKAEVQREVRA